MGPSWFLNGAALRDAASMPSKEVSVLITELKIAAAVTEPNKLSKEGRVAHTMIVSVP